MPSKPAPTSRAGVALRQYADELLALGRSAGLDRVGIAPARPFERARVAIEHRVAHGYADSMQFTFRSPERSTDPSATLPGARSIFVGAIGYHEPDLVARPEGKPTARVARYAWRDNYATLRTSLGVVADELRSVGHRAVVLADDNALVDREAAHLAGLGWFGKNANLLLQGSGSWFVLGSVITDAVLPASTPVADGCGSCRRCIDSCPTGAIVEPGVIDAARCIAWVLQKPGVMDRSLRGAVDDRIYGCDDCQESCPPSVRSARKGVDAVVAGAEAFVDPVAILNMTDAQILAAHGRWYIHDRDPRWVRRNALVVLGNVATPSDAAAREVLAGYVAHADPVLRAHAVWAVARIGHADLVPADDPDDVVRRELNDLPPVRG